MSIFGAKIQNVNELKIFYWWSGGGLANEWVAESQGMTQAFSHSWPLFNYLGNLSSKWLNRGDTALFGDTHEGFLIAHSLAPLNFSKASRALVLKAQVLLVRSWVIRIWIVGDATFKRHLRTTIMDSQKIERMIRIRPLETYRSWAAVTPELLLCGDRSPTTIGKQTQFYYTSSKNWKVLQKCVQIVLYYLLKIWS